MQAISDGPTMSDRKIDVRIALLEKSSEYTECLLERIEKKVDKVDIKVDKLETKIFNNFKWFFSGIIALATLGFSIYQYVKH